MLVVNHYLTNKQGIAFQMTKYETETKGILVVHPPPSQASVVAKPSQGTAANPEETETKPLYMLMETQC